METMYEFFDFHLIRNWCPSQERSHLIGQFTKFEVLSLDCNRVEGL